MKKERPKIACKFIREGRVERPPTDPHKGGFEVDIIPVGTVAQLSPASVNFWLDRDCIVILKPDAIPDANPAPEVIEDANPFATI